MEPDWDYWRQIPEATLLECVLLSCDMEPRESEDENFWRYNHEVLARIEEVKISIYEEELKATSLIGIKLPNETERANYCTIPRICFINDSKRISDKTAINLVRFSRWAVFKRWEIPGEMESIKRLVTKRIIPEPIPTAIKPESNVSDERSDPFAKHGLSSDELDEMWKSIEDPPTTDISPEELDGFWQSIQNDLIIEPTDTPEFPEQPQPKEQLLEWKPEDLSLRGKEGIINRAAVQQGGEHNPTTIVVTGTLNVNLVNRDGNPLSIYATSTPPTQPEAVASGTTAALSMVGAADSTSSLLPEPSTPPVTSAKAVAVYGIDPTPARANTEAANQTRIKNAAARKSAVLSAMEYILEIDETWKGLGIPYQKQEVIVAMQSAYASMGLSNENATLIRDATEGEIMSDFESLTKEGEFFFRKGKRAGMTPLLTVLSKPRKTAHFRRPPTK